MICPNWRVAAAVLSSAAILLQACLYASAEPGKPMGVVELFTSQGCNSCPPADAVLGELANRDDVIALAYHVDYWDYLGWRDTLAKPENTQRQHDYGKAFGARSVYTPQAVINGRTHVNGSKKPEVAGALMKLEEDGQGLLVDLKSSQKGDSIVIEAAAGSYPREAHLVLVFFDSAIPVEIQRGENSGSTITYWNAVTGLQTAGVWHGKAARFELPAVDILKNDGCVALLQAADKDGLPGPILGATMVRKPDAPSTK
jgi:hypothetical protein